ncbi:PRC-barrel domain-containing protein [Mycobacterium koreense]|uniref:Uncharacterized protein n=1 Tax=Mycolicibacillus koreensis TaxID=1069220 RepID=A0A7I7SF59_9MYCO|nr:PRC-barrel domain-containing protein [Mycolicibacillus koreensis]MCV7248615.1 PRC-barrel domain-containing protein [Mycolicibacillus koreensis]ODR11855.1 hypothetical protein BHQ15_01360 [Mycolicibacillus koreensis]OSC34026.1 hypothetical protein B8W67_08525 [Mycolicibacillus koreensis]BBY55577.1 hypothetical protein MKOR_28280 [Mycolicibacillus koreensis]
MSGSDCAALYRLTGAVAGLPNAADDLRRRTVFGVGHVRLGTVSAALVDEPERRPRFVVVGSGGVAGIGRRHRAVPVDRIIGTTVADVFLDVTGDQLADGPAYAPDRITDRDYLEGIYRYYDRTPCWASGYVFPDFNR